jgi:urea transport system substrate-binding protein
MLPRTNAMLATHHLKAKYQAAPVGNKFVPIGHQDFAKVVKDIKLAKPDVILNAVLGDSLINLFGELADAKLTPVTTPVCSLLLGEHELQGLDSEKVEGHFAAAGYFQSLDTPRNKEFVKQFAAKTTNKAPAYAEVEAAYSAVWLWKAAAEKAKSFEVDKIREAVRGLEVEAPSGKLKIDEKNQHAWKNFRLGRIRDDRQFDLLFESKEPVRPEPYSPPLNATRDCDWTRGGLIQVAPK